MCLCAYTPGREIFFKMEPGDEVRLTGGIGFPETAQETVEIIVAVDGYSALTHTGRRLNGFDAPGIELTGNYFKEGTYAISAEACEILDEAAALQANCDDSDAGWDTTVKTGSEEDEESWTGY